MPHCREMEREIDSVVRQALNEHRQHHTRVVGKWQAALKGAEREIRMLRWCVFALTVIISISTVLVGHRTGQLDLALTVAHERDRAAVACQAERLYLDALASRSTTHAERAVKGSQRVHRSPRSRVFEMNPSQESPCKPRPSASPSRRGRRRPS